MTATEKNNRRESKDGKIIYVDDGRINEYFSYRILTIIHKKEYVNSYTGYYKRQNIHRHIGNGSIGFPKYGCVCSAAAINHLISGVKNNNMEEILKRFRDLGLIELEEHPEKKNWYTKICLTKKGKHFLSIYEKLLKLVNYFELRA